MKYLKPSADHVSEMLGMLYDGDVDPIEVKDVGDAAYVATFVNPEGEVVAACLSDAGMTIFSGAALSMLPPGGAKDMVSDKEFTKSVLDNFYEVMNICSRLLMSNSTPHLKLAEVIPMSTAAQSLGSLSNAVSICYELGIPKYGKGRVQFLVS